MLSGVALICGPRRDLTLRIIPYRHATHRLSIGDDQPSIGK
jgi:hypothetical protein